ncbi:hypothetical protein GCM10007216_12570 [Thalassobacillus devorans]|uniref:Spo0E like sporulation regulatory protein n=1 Tax=Thalassobacillus devorans TaxID=279813 RepID=A0ABQ1NRV7_9BACI|nr:hypothetical protein [Thalassobacillus devorans]NIK28801.1 hypothetical protein [Thalassobacillus devorans]GGC83423.1 hypothetical protein GCM10007216_12570 [Thalassobacillus devorans]
MEEQRKLTEMLQNLIQKTETKEIQSSEEMIKQIVANLEGYRLQN